MNMMKETTGKAFREIYTNKVTILILAVLPWLAALLAEPFFMLRVHAFTLQTLAADYIKHAGQFTAVWGFGMVFPTLCYMLGELNETFCIGVDLLDDICPEEKEITEYGGHVGIFSASSAMLGMVVYVMLDKELAGLSGTAVSLLSVIGAVFFLVMCILTADRIRSTVEKKNEVCSVCAEKA